MCSHFHEGVDAQTPWLVDWCEKPVDAVTRDNGGGIAQPYMQMHHLSEQVNDRTWVWESAIANKGKHAGGAVGGTQGWMALQGHLVDPDSIQTCDVRHDETVYVENLVISIRY